MVRGIWAVWGLALLLAVPMTAAAAPPIEAYGKLPAVELMRLSPSADKYAFIATAGEARKLYVVTLAGKVLVAAAVGDNKVRDISWAGDDHLLVFVSSTLDLRADFGAKYELGRAFHIDLTTGKVSTVFDTAASVVKTIMGYHGSARVDGRWYGYFGGITLGLGTDRHYVFDHGWPDLYKVDLTDGTATIAARGDAQNHNWVVDADGVVAARSLYNQKSGQWRMFAGAGFGRPIRDVKAPIPDIAMLGLGRTADSVLVLDNTGGRSRMEEVSLADGSGKPLWTTSLVTDVDFDNDTHLLIGARTDEEPGGSYFDPKLQARYLGARKAFPKLRVTLESYGRNFDWLITRSEGNKDSGTFWIVDIAHGAADPIGDIHPDIPPEAVGDTSLFGYRAADGLEMDGVLTLPPGREAKGLPVVVMPHGGPIDARDRPGFDWWAQAFASRGYAVFQPNFRGSGGRSAAFRQAGFGQWGRKMQTDISDGVAALAAMGIIDPKRACIVGASYGGYAALAGVTLQQGLYRCAVSVAGPANMASFFSWQGDMHGAVSGATRYWRAVTGADTEGMSVMRSISPASFAEQADAPILLIHGKDDTVVPFEQSRQMASALKAAGKPVELVTMVGEDHWLSREATRITMLKASVAFVEQHNPPQ